jgi:hypothetical protein
MSVEMTEGKIINIYCETAKDKRHVEYLLECNDPIRPMEVAVMLQKVIKDIYLEHGIDMKFVQVKMENEARH